MGLYVKNKSKQVMRKNHWHTAGSKQRQAAYKYGYRSGLELKVSEQIAEANYPVNYETETLQYTVPEQKSKYTPDFVFTKKTGELMYIETKGRWTATDRKKMKHILLSNPDIDLRIVFQNPAQKISKTSKTTYESYALKLGIKHVAKKQIPEEWLAECVKNGEEPNNPKKFFE
jgi:hypothetical protein